MNVTPFEIVKLGLGAVSLENFDCGVQDLNDFLKNQSISEQAKGSSVTYLAVEHASLNCLGFVSISSCSFKRSKLLAEFAVGIRYPSVPAILIGRLAVSTLHQKKGVGCQLLKYALGVSLTLADTVGISVVAVDAKSDALRAYYRRYGFISLGESLNMYLPIATVRDALG